MCFVLDFSFWRNLTDCTIMQFITFFYVVLQVSTWCILASVTSLHMGVIDSKTMDYSHEVIIFGHFGKQKTTVCSNNGTSSVYC